MRAAADRMRENKGGCFGGFDSCISESALKRTTVDSVKRHTSTNGLIRLLIYNYRSLEEKRRGKKYNTSTDSHFIQA